MVVVLLFTLPGPLPLGARELRETQRSVGETLALSLTSTLTSLPLQALSWRRATPLSKPYVCGPASPHPVSTLNLSHDGAFLALAFSPPPPHPQLRGVGVDLVRVSRVRDMIGSMECGGNSLILGTAPSNTPVPTLPSPPTGSTDPALLFALRWTIMEAVLKARGEGLAVEGAGLRILKEAREEEGWGGGLDDMDSRTSATTFPTVWGAAIPGSTPVTPEEVRSGCDAALQGYLEGRVGLSNTVLGVYQGEGWASTTFLVEQSGGEDLVVTAAEATLPTETFMTEEKVIGTKA